MTFGRFACCATCFGALDAVVHGIAQQVHERVADLFDDGLVQFGLRAIDDQVDVLAQFLADIAHHTAEAIEGVADGDHAQVQRAIQDLLDQPRYGRTGFLKRVVVARLGQQAGASAGNDQLADQIDQLVELVGVDAHIAAVLVFLLAGRRRALYSGCRCRCRCRCGRSWHCALIAQQFAAGHHRAVLGLRDQFGAGALDVVWRLVRWGDFHGAVFTHEIEDFVDRGVPGSRAEVDLETQVAGFRVPRLNCWNTVGYRRDLDHLPQGIEIAQERQWVHAVAKHIHAKT